MPRSLTLLTALVLTSTALQAQNYIWVYRMDTRPPEEVFLHGFTGAGSDTSLLGHALFGSCDADVTSSRSAWVSTTANQQRADAFARQQVYLPGAGETQGMWRYRIRTDSNYINIENVLNQVISAGRQYQFGFTPVHSGLLAQLLAITPISQRQEVVTRRVAPENIHSATFYSTSAMANNQTVVIFPLRLNDEYRIPTTQMNNQVVLQTLVPPGSIRLYESTQSCSLACDGASSRSERKRRSLVMQGLYCTVTPSATKALIGSDDD